MALPPFNADGDLPIGVHRATLQEVMSRFGVQTAQRQAVALRLERIYRLAIASGPVARFVVFGSFVTDKLDPNDVDVFMLLENAFDGNALSGEAKVLFDHPASQAHFGASIFWLRRLTAFSGEQAAVEDWQTKHGGGRRGIIEIIEDAT